MPGLSMHRERFFRNLLRLKQLGTVLLYALMLLAVIALWNNHAPQFIYVAF
jgi:hypothetical protein